MAGDLRPDLVVLGSDSQPGSTAEMIRALCVGSPGTSVVVLAENQDRVAVVDALRAGAAGLLTTQHAPEAIGRALRGLMRGEAALTREATTFLVEEVQREDRRRDPGALGPRRDRLTPRQLEILQLLASGASTSEVATTLYLSVETVRWHVKSILRKLGVRSRAEAIACLDEMIPAS